jgi:hypothetical protein
MPLVEVCGSAPSRLESCCGRCEVLRETAHEDGKGCGRQPGWALRVRVAQRKEEREDCEGSLQHWVCEREGVAADLTKSALFVHASKEEAA